MPTIVGSPKKKGPYPFAELTGEKKFRFGESHTYSVVSCGFSVPHILIVGRLNFATQIKSILITQHDFTEVITFVFNFVKRFTTKSHLAV